MYRENGLGLHRYSVRNTLCSAVKVLGLFFRVSWFCIHRYKILLNGRFHEIWFAFNKAISVILLPIFLSISNVLYLQCNLHIHASYSISQKLNVPMAPLSEPNAVGIIIAHGNELILYKYTMK